MKKLMLLIATFSGIAVYGQNQNEINKYTNAESRKKELELIYIIDKIKIEYEDDALFLKSLEESQKAWVTYKNAMIKAKYPNINQPNYYGSSLGLCISTYTITLTENRIKELKFWLDGLPEGDVCSGSVKSNSIEPIKKTLVKTEENALYSKSSGFALNVSGWGIGARPQINDDSGESGRIVFDIAVDDTGDIVSIVTKDATVSKSVIETYRRGVGKMKLVPKSENVPRLSKGTITFNIKSR